MKVRISSILIAIVIITSILVVGCGGSPSTDSNGSNVPETTTITSTPTEVPSPTATLRIPVSQGTLVPNAGVAITSENISQVSEIGRWGRGVSLSQAAYSPDGKQFVVAASLGIYIFDAETLEEISFLQDTPTTINQIGYSPNGKLIGISSGDTVTLLNTSDYSIARTIGSGAFSFSPNSEILATYLEGKVDLWNLSDGNLLYSWDLPGSNLTFAPDGNSIFSFNFSNGVFSQSQTSDGKLLDSFTTKQATGSSISSDGKTLIIFTDEGVKLYNVLEKKLITTLEIKNALFESAIVFSPDNKLVSMATGFGSARVWNVADGKELLRINDEDAEKIFKKMFESKDFGPLYFYTSSGWAGFSPDGKSLLHIENHTIHLWSVTDGSILREHKAFSFPVQKLTQSPDQNILASVSKGVVQLAEYPSGSIINDQISSYALNVEFLSDGRIITSTNPNINIISLDKIDQPQILVEAQGASRIAISHDNVFIALQSVEQSVSGISVVRVEDGKQMFFLNNGEMTLSDIEFSPDNKYLAASSKKFGISFAGFPPNVVGDQTIIYNMENGERIGLYKPTTGEVYEGTDILIREAADGSHFAFSPDGKYLATGAIVKNPNNANTYKLDFWDLQKLALVYSIDQSIPITGLTFSHDGSLIVSGNQIGNITFWNATDGSIISELNGHTSTINDLLFTKDDANLISSSDDGTIRIWGIKP